MSAAAKHISTTSRACGHFCQPGTAHPLPAAYLPGALHLKTPATFTPADGEKSTYFSMRKHRPY